MRRFFIIGILATAFLLCACHTAKVAVVERVVHDTTYIAQYKADSIYMHDSIFIKDKGDTIYISNWHTKYIERLKVDTIYQSRTDSIPVPYEVERIVKERPRFLVACTILFWLLVVVSLFVIATRIYIKIHKPI